MKHKYTFASCMSLHVPFYRPIGGQKKTFDELLEEQLKLEEQRLMSVQQQQVRENNKRKK